MDIKHLWEINFGADNYGGFSKYYLITSEFKYASAEEAAIELSQSKLQGKTFYAITYRGRVFERI